MKGNSMRYIDPTVSHNDEPTYNRFQVVSGSITIAAIIGIIIYATTSLISSF